MKTAVQHIQECLHILDDSIDPTYAELWQYIEDLPDVMKDYAAQCVAKSLLDASEKAFKDYKDSGMTNLAEKCRISILSTPIVTP